MNDQRDYVDYETLVRRARMERSVAIGAAIANGVAALSALISRANAALWHPSVRSKSASAHR